MYGSAGHAMKRIVLAAVLLLPLQTPARFEINGKVVSDTTGEAIAGAQVTLVAAPPGVTTGVGFAGGLVGTFITGTPPPPISPPAVPPVPPPQVPAVTATSDGRFSFRDLSAGTYRLTVAANGYVRQEYGQRSAYSQGTPITLIAGQTNGDLTVRLIPTGTVTGHVLDDLGRPAMDAPVQLVRVVYGPDGKRFQAMASGNANDRGEYRLFWLPPGQYYVRAGQKDRAQQEFAVYQQLQAQHMAAVDKERAEVQQFVYSEKPGSVSKP